MSCSVQFSSVAQSCPTLCDPMDWSMPGLPVHHQIPEFTETHVHRVGDAIQPSPSPVIPFSSCHPLFLLPSIFPSIRVFSSESVLHITWPKYWRFSFRISPYKEYSGLISFRMDWLSYSSCVQTSEFYMSSLYVTSFLHRKQWVIGFRRELKEDWTQRQWVVVW